MLPRAVDSQSLRTIRSLKAPPIAPEQTSESARAHAEARKGVICGLAAYGFWGMVPIYFKSVKHVPPIEVLAHRVVWAVPLTLAMCWFVNRWSTLRAVFRNPQNIAVLSLTATLIAVNWFVYIWAITNNRVMEASLGYYINPLVNVALGVVLLGERLRKIQVVCVALAGIGVGYLTWKLGAAPVIPLTLAFSFGTYGLLRKRAPVDPLTGLTVECVLLYPVALGYTAFLASRGGGAFGHGGALTSFLLILAGPFTSIPLLWFAAAAKRLRLATMGFLQYVAPTLQFSLAVFLYGETFTHAHAIAFGFIWSALALYSWDTWRSSTAK